MAKIHHIPIGAKPAPMLRHLDIGQLIDDEFAEGKLTIRVEADVREVGTRPDEV